jgi:DNA-binding beta-propeller fold protein YncE
MSHRSATRIRPWLSLFSAVLISIRGAFAAEVWVSRSIQLPAEARALRVDSLRDLIYVSVPSNNRVFVYDLPTFTFKEKIYVGFYPYGIDLSSDGKTLYAALGFSGAIGVYDLDGGTQFDIDISIPLGSSYTYDVAEALPGIVFASASP